jgi:dipeptidase D
MRTTFSRPLTRSVGQGTCYVLNLGGLRGGHSGRVIDKELGNALKLAARVLYAISWNQSLRLITLEGGDKDNAIPRECSARFLINGETAPGAFDAAAWVESWETSLKAELGDRAPDFFLSLEVEGAEAGQCPALPISVEDTQDILQFLRMLPDGPYHRNPALDGLVLNSANLASVHPGTAEVLVTLSLRSSLGSLLEDLRDQEEIAARLCGFSCRHGAAYPPWAYEENSPLRDTFTRVYRKRYNRDPKVLALHIGLECGVFKEKRPDLDIISIGPTVEAIHSPTERMNIPSFLRTYRFLEDVLSALCP